MVIVVEDRLDGILIKLNEIKHVFTVFLWTYVTENDDKFQEVDFRYELTWISLLYQLSDSNGLLDSMIDRSVNVPENVPKNKVFINGNEISDQYKVV